MTNAQRNAVETAVGKETQSLERSIEEATCFQVRNLTAAIEGERVQVTGRCGSYYVKQLVTQAVHAVFPAANLSNNVEVCNA